MSPAEGRTRAPSRPTGRAAQADHIEAPWQTAYEALVVALCHAVDALQFSEPVAFVYNPLDYAREAHLEYLVRFGKPPKDVLFVGMNPGPWGMAQTGVPFGAVPIARDWLRISAPIGRPANAHPKRPIEGQRCPRVEVSGQRFWGWIRERFGTPERFATRFMVWNYCPLMFLEESGRNLTPDKLRKAEREAVQASCDAALRRLLETVTPRVVVGVGAYAEQRLRVVVGEQGPLVGRILHPSPASPKANRDWTTQAEADLRGLGIDLP